MLRRPFHFVGLQTLKIKETDRIAALQTELRKMDIDVVSINDSELRCDAYPQKPYAELPPPTIATYEDHRMAMAFAPCALQLGSINIEHPEVVSKSYPTFWNDIAKIEQT
jgi:3-phosphoshikimate 1-carboxyvinyltransferase